MFLQATAEQIRLAQMISDHNDADFEEKVKQVSRDLNSLAHRKILAGSALPPSQFQMVPTIHKKAIQYFLGGYGLTVASN